MVRLGRGGFGAVYSGEPGNRIVAVKVVPYDTAVTGERAEARKEAVARVLRACEHPNMLRVSGSFERANGPRSDLRVVLEMADKQIRCESRADSTRRPTRRGINEGCIAHVCACACHALSHG